MVARNAICDAQRSISVFIGYPTGGNLNDAGIFLSGTVASCGSATKTLLDSVTGWLTQR